MSTTLTNEATPSNRSKLLTEAFGGLNQLTGEAELRARRQSERNVTKLQEQKLNGQQFAARVAGRVIGEALTKALGGSGSDAELKRAQLVDEAVAAAQDITGFEVPQAEHQQLRQQVTQQGVESAVAAAKGRSSGIQTTNAFEQQHVLITNTMRELANRGLAKEAANLLPTLKALEEADVEERMRLAELEGKELANEDARDGTPTSIIPNSTGVAVEAQVFSDGTATYFDEQAQSIVPIRPGQYVSGKLTGGRESLESNEIKQALPALRGISNTLSMATALRTSIVENPEALTVTGDVLAFINNYLPKREFEALRSALARTQPEAFKAAAGEIRKYLTDNNIDNSLQRVLVERLGFSLASAREGGKLSVSDVEFAMRAFGQGERDPDVRLGLIDDIVRELNDSYVTIAAISPEKVPSIPLYQRAGTLFDAYAEAEKLRPVRKIGDRLKAQENASDFLYQNDRGVTIE